MYEEDVTDAILAYLDHVLLKIKENPDYEPHPILKAMMLASPKEDSKYGKYMGVSGNGNAKKRIEPTESYCVVLEKKENISQLIEIKDLMTGNTISTYDALLIIELSLKLEKMKGERISADEIEKLLNETCNNIKFKVINPKNYQEARDYFKERLEQKKVPIPNDNDLISDLLKIKTSSKWDEYPPKVRGLIASIWAAKYQAYGLSLDSDEVPKNRVIPIFKTFFTGEINKILLENLKKG